MWPHRIMIISEHWTDEVSECTHSLSGGCLLCEPHAPSTRSSMVSRRCYRSPHAAGRHTGANTSVWENLCILSSIDHSWTLSPFGKAEPTALSDDPCCHAQSSSCLLTQLLYGVSSWLEFVFIQYCRMWPIMLSATKIPACLACF